MTNLIQYNIFKFHNKFFDRFEDDIDGLMDFIHPLKFDKESVDNNAPCIIKYIRCTNFTLLDNLNIMFGSYYYHMRRDTKSQYYLSLRNTDKCIKFGFHNGGEKTLFFSYSREYSFISYYQKDKNNILSYFDEPTITATRSYKFDEDKILEKTLKADSVNFFVPEYIVNLL